MVALIFNIRASPQTRPNHDRVHGDWLTLCQSARALAQAIDAEPGPAAVRDILARILGVLGGPQCRVVYPSGDQVEYVVTVFECSRVSGALVTETDETASLHWFSLSEMPPLAFPFPSPILSGDGPRAYFDWDDGYLALVGRAG